MHSVAILTIFKNASRHLDTYFKAFAPDLTQWFPSGRVDLPSYQASWRKYIAAGNRLDGVEVRDLRVQIGPAGDAAVATYILRVTTRTAKGAVSVEDNQETDVLFKRGGEWKIAHRQVIIDSWRIFADACDWERGVFGIKPVPGKRGADDPSADLFGNLLFSRPI